MAAIVKISKLELYYKDGSYISINMPALLEHETFMLEDVVKRLKKTQPQSFVQTYLHSLQNNRQRITEPHNT